MKGITIEAHIADIHFGVIDPSVQIDILRNQFIYTIKQLPLNIVSINGDLFHKKYPTNSIVITYASMFVAELVELCKEKEATLLILHGTESHDSHQFNIFYPYTKRKDVDVRIIEEARYEFVKNKLVLCIPEEYNKGAEYYNSLFGYTSYDACYMHGTYVNSVYGRNKEDLDNKKDPTFSKANFWRCKGPVIAGHVHIAQCLDSHVYYSGSPIRWQFGEERPKGFLILCQNLDTDEYYINFQEITSFRYETIDMDSILLSDPKDIINYLETLKANGYDYIRIIIKKFTDNIPIIKDYFRTSNWLSIEDKSKEIRKLEESQSIYDKYKDMDFLFDSNLDEYTKFVMYINHYEGEGFISIDALKRLIKE